MTLLKLCVLVIVIDIIGFVVVFIIGKKIIKWGAPDMGGEE